MRFRAAADSIRVGAVTHRILLRYTTMPQREPKFTGPGGKDPVEAARELEVAVQPTAGDLLLAGQILRSRIVQRTAQGLDADGAPFAPYSTKGPFYFYPDGGAGRTHEQRAKQAAGRHKKTGKIGQRTRLGIKYDSYAAAKAAQGRGNVDLFGLVQHPHMLNAMVVKAGGAEIDQAGEGFFGGGSELDAFGQSTPTSQLHIGFYGEEAERAKGHNEGTKHLPRRHFFDASADDLKLMSDAMGQRMLARAKSKDQK